MRDAFAAAFLVGLEGSLAAALGVAALRGTALACLAAPFAGAVAAGLAAGVASFLLEGGTAGDLAPALHRTGHLSALALAALALLARGRDAESLAAGRRRAVAEALALATGLLVLLPEGGFLAAKLADLAVLRGSALPVVAAAGCGLALAAALGALAAAVGVRARATRFLAPSGVLALLLAVELAGVAARAVDAYSLPVAVTGVVSRVAHDAVHLLFVLLQVPDHAYLEDWAYQLVLRFLEPAVHAALAALAVAAPIAAAWRAFARRPAIPLPPAARVPERRLARAAFLRTSRLGAVAFAAALALSASALWSARGDGEALYDPVPEPVVDDGKGHIIVPLGGPLAAAETRMRKWVYAANGRSVTFFTMRRPDGSLAAALDLCEICQPKGYAQMGAGYVYCKYCKTPIPVSTVGQPGGCNPVPIPGAVLAGAVLLVPRDAAVAAFEKGVAEKR